MCPVAALSSLTPDCPLELLEISTGRHQLACASPLTRTLYSFSPQVTRKLTIIVEVFTKKSWDFSDRNCCRLAIFMVRDSVSVEATDLAA